MQQRLSLVTLGVADVPKARRFYESLGWRAAPGDSPDIAFFQMGGMILALWGREALAEDAKIAGGAPAPGAVALAHNVASRAEVDTALAAAKKAGARIVKPAAETFWGGYSGYFADPDGHPWEIAHNPFWTLDADGAIRLPE